MFKTLLKLFVAFVKIGAFTFGGGYAMLPMLEKELVENNKWTTEEELMDYFAIGQCTPGVIAVNTATFIGKKVAGVLGAIVATFGVVLPSMIIITIVAAFLGNISENPYVQHAFGGIRVCVCVLITNAVLKLGQKSLVNWFSWVVCIAVTALALFTDIQTAFLVLGAGAIGVVIAIVNGVKAKKQPALAQSGDGAYNDVSNATVAVDTDSEENSNFTDGTVSNDADDDSTKADGGEDK